MQESIEKSFSFHGFPCIYFDGKYHIYNYFTQKSVSFSDLDLLSKSEVLDFLKNNGVISEGFIPKNTDSGNELHLTFITTTDCNLACDYCYAESKRKKLYLSSEVSTAIIDRLLGDHYDGQLFVQFFGGEPTLNMSVIKTVVTTVKKKANVPFFYITTNGTFDDSVLQYLIDEKIGIYISIDGIEADHNIHRKTADGKGSYTKVINNLKKIIKSGLACKVRSTITPANITNMTVFAEDMFELGVKLIHFTPMARIGYANDEPPTMLAEDFENLFCYKLNQVLDIAKQYHAQVITPISLALNRFPRPHCKVFDNNQKIIISPEGKRTLCYGMQSLSNTYSEHFLYEDYDFVTGNFNSKPEIKKALCDAYNLNVKHHCSNCFASFACSGGCFAQNLYSNSRLHILDESFCSIHKKMVFMLLRRVLGC